MLGHAYYILFYNRRNPNPLITMCKNNSTILSFFSVVRNLTFNVGSDVNLTCSNKTWSETMYVFWKINLKYKGCKIAFSNEGRSEDSCNDGKSLRNTSRAQSYLRIPNFSNDDVGVYRCESVYIGGSEDYEINVAITGGTFLLTRIDDFQNHVINKVNPLKGQFSQITLKKIH